MKQITAGTAARTITLLLALINQICLCFGVEILPIADETINLFVTTGFTIVSSAWAWWKNNSFTFAARKADTVMHVEKEKEYATQLAEADKEIV